MADRRELLERADALDRLTQLAHQAATGCGQVTAVVAPAGVGKTSLLAVASAGLVRSGLRVLMASGSEQERSLPHGVTRALLEPALADPQTRAEVLVDAASPAGALLHGGAGSGPLHHALYWTIANLARSGPLALVVDDAHWSDDASVEVLAYVARRVADLPVLVVVAMRPSGQAEWHPDLADLHARATEVTLAALSEAAVAEFVGRELSSGVSERFARACGRATGGNPFYLTELVRDVVRRGLAPGDEQADVVDDVVPATIVRSVLLRLASLGSGAPNLARAVAVLGEGARLDQAAALAGVDIDAAAASADALTQAGVLADASTGLRFAHPILHAAVLGDLGRHEQSRWHSRAATLLTETGAAPAVVAAHLLRCEPAGDPRAAATLLTAAREATAAGSPGTAVQLLRRARDEPPAPADRGAHFFELGVAEALQGDLDALGDLEASIRLAESAEVRAERAVMFAEFARKATLVPAAIDALDTALADLARDSPLAAVLAMRRYSIGRTNLATYDRVRASRGELQRALAAVDPGTRRTAAVFLAWEAALSGPRSEALRLLDEALAPPGLLRVVELGSSAIAAALITLTMVERHDEHDTLLTEIRALAGRTGNSVAAVAATIYHGMELDRRGRPDGAEAEAALAMSFSSGGGWPAGSPELTCVQATALLGRGDIEGAQAVLVQAPFDVAAPDSVPTALLLDTRGQVALARGDTDTAIADCTAAGSCVDKLEVSNPALVAWRRHAASAFLVGGDTQEARRLAEEEVALARELSGPIAQAGSMRVLATTLPAADRIDVLREAASLVGGGPGLMVQGQVAADLGAALRRTGQIGDARRILTEAVDLADRCGAGSLAHHAREELLAAGGRPRRTRVTGAEALTPSEARVARLAQDGLTNTVIAQTLFVSRKTVEKHLANAYGKLGITSRAGLAGIDLG